MLTYNLASMMGKFKGAGMKNCKFLNFNFIHNYSMFCRCRHNSNSRCVHCSALEPYDETYLREQKIKHLSFHAYLRKMTSGVDRGKFLALEDISCRIRNGCKDHPPWPKGICSKCQPNAITLNRQVKKKGN